MADLEPVAIGIDPDTHKTAIVIASELEVFQVMTVKAKEGDDAEAAALRMVWALAPAFESLGREATVVVIEGQQIYNGSSPATPESILVLAQVTGACIAYTNLVLPNANIWTPRPSQWKGQVPKAIHQARTYASYGWQSSLHPATKAPVDCHYSYPSGCSEVTRVPGWHKTKQSDWLHLGDALGLALWGCRRIKRLRAAQQPKTSP